MVSIAVRREEKDQEKKSPLVPEDIEFLKTKFNIETLIQPSTQRTYSDSEYVNKGAVLEEDIHKKSDFIFALHETPVNLVLNGKRYKSLCIFNHSLEGNNINNEMLKKIIRSKSTLIEFDKITDEKNKKVFHFDSFIGHAGMIDSFWALAQKLRNQGLETPLLKINQAFKYPSLENATESLKRIGKEIDIIGLSYPDGPLIIGILGIGNISNAVQEIINCIPCQEMKPEELEEFFEGGYFSENRIYYVVFQEKHLVKPIELEDDFELQDYYANPGKYESQFDKYLPFLTVIINTIHWEPGYPKFITKKLLKRLYEGGLSILRVIGDLSGDVGGAIELTIKRTTSKEPVFTFDLSNEKIEMGFIGRGPTILAIENLSSEFPRESSKYFSNILKNYIPKIVNANYSGNSDQSNLPDDIKKGLIVFKGELSPNFKFLVPSSED